MLCLWLVMKCHRIFKSGTPAPLHVEPHFEHSVMVHALLSQPIQAHHIRSELAARPCKHPAHFPVMIFFPDNSVETSRSDAGSSCCFALHHDDHCPHKQSAHPIQALGCELILHHSANGLGRESTGAEDPDVRREAYNLSLECLQQSVNHHVNPLRMVHKLSRFQAL